MTVIHYEFGTMLVPFLVGFFCLYGLCSGRPYGLVLLALGTLALLGGAFPGQTNAVPTLGVVFGAYLGAMHAKTVHLEHLAETARVEDERRGPAPRREDRG
ncbi:MAG: hypothetical protein AAF074_16685 [Pseudomonadota bacterium]